MRQPKRPKLTDLELFVWNNPHADFQELATMLNRPLRSVEAAYTSACRNQRAKVNAVLGSTMLAELTQGTH
jgi:hypothetical protein